MHGLSGQINPKSYDVIICTIAPHLASSAKAARVGPFKGECLMSRCVVGRDLEGAPPVTGQCLYL